MKAENRTSEPHITHRESQYTIGIRTVTPFKGMFAEVTKLLKELRLWVNQHVLAEEGPFFLRYYVIDMKGPMDIEVGFITKQPQSGDDRVKPGMFPAGRYANLVYTGNGLRGNRALLDWAKQNQIPLDRRNEQTGDAFACRYEAYLTDYRKESRKKLWEINLAVKVKEG